MCSSDLHIDDANVDGFHFFECGTDDRQSGWFGVTARGGARRLALGHAIAVATPCGYFYGRLFLWPSTAVTSIAFRVANDLAHRIGHEKSRIASGDDDVAQTGRGDL